MPSRGAFHKRIHKWLIISAWESPLRKALNGFGSAWDVTQDYSGIILSHLR